MTKLKIKRGDNVIITTGKKEIKGKKGEVIEVIRKEGKDARVIVAGLNIVKKYLEAIHGNLSFHSKENIGTSFHVKIPINAK